MTSPLTIFGSRDEAEADATTSSAGACGCGGCGCSTDEAPSSTAPIADATAGAATPQEVADGVERLDVRALAPAQRHEQILGRVGALEPGEAFVLVNDHDPRPLRYQLDAEEPGQVTWEYLEQGPEVWQVRIGRVAGHCC